MNNKLIIGKFYSRKQVHDFFSPCTNYTSGAGTWGLQGIVKIDLLKSDFVLFVTYKEKQNEYKFNDFLNEDGNLFWCSQPKQRIKDKVIQELINSKNNNIYLFLRRNKLEDYCYFGRLEYVSHDPNSNCPVFFTWKLKEVANSKLNGKEMINKFNNNQKNETLIQKEYEYGQNREKVIKDVSGNYPELDKNNNSPYRELESVSIDNLNLSVRTYNVLRRNGIDNVGLLLNVSEEALLKMKNMGRISVDEISSIQKRLKVYYMDRVEKTGKNELFLTLQISTLNLPSQVVEVLSNAGIYTILDFLRLNDIDYWFICFKYNIDINNIYNVKKVLQDKYSNGFDFGIVEEDELKELSFSVRAYNVLKNNGINTLYQFISLSRSQINLFEQCGKTTISELIRRQEWLKRNNSKVREILFYKVVREIHKNNENLSIEDLLDKESSVVFKSMGIVNLGDLKNKIFDQKEIERLNLNHTISVLEKYKESFKDLIYKTLLHIIQKPKKDGTPYPARYFLYKKFNLFC